MSRYGRIERGYMAADRFTQVSNELARDRRLSRKARGLFLEIASHRDGYGLTVEALVRTGPEGRGAIMTGLQELEQHGYLERHQERDERGRLGMAVYRITDSPESRRSDPSSKNPTTGEPTSADALAKKTKIKKTSQQKTNPFPPSCPGKAEPRKDGEEPALPTMSEGTSLLLEIGVREPRLAIGGVALVRCGSMLDVLLEAGWDTEAVRAALTGGLPERVTSPAGFLARRISHIPPAPAALPARSTAALPKHEETYTPPRYGDHITTPALRECDDCGVPPVPGHSWCAACMGWPTCTGCARRRTPPDSNGLCRVCDEEHGDWQAAQAAWNTFLENPRD